MDTHSLCWWCSHCGLRKCSCIDFLMPSIKVLLSFHAWNSSKSRVFFIHFKKNVFVALWCSPFSSTLIACHPLSIICGIFFCEFLHFFLYTLNTFRSFYSRIFFYAFLNFDNIGDFLFVVFNYLFIVRVGFSFFSSFFPPAFPLIMELLWKLEGAYNIFSRKLFPLSR